MRRSGKSKYMCRSSRKLTIFKVRVLRGMPAIEPKNVIIGQYGKSLDGSKPGYKEDDTVPKESRCPTFASMVAYIKNERWDGVPFIMKAGKGSYFLRLFPPQF